MELGRQRDFGIIFLDVHMPKISGYEILRKIRQMKPEQKVVVMSSGSEPSHGFEEEARGLGASGCLHKPFDVDQILKAAEDFRD